MCQGWGSHMLICSFPPSGSSCTWMVECFLLFCCPDNNNWCTGHIRRSFCERTEGTPGGTIACVTAISGHRRILFEMIPNGKIVTVCMSNVIFNCTHLKAFIDIRKTWLLSSRHSTSHAYVLCLLPQLSFSEGTSAKPLKVFVLLFRLGN